MTGDDDGVVPPRRHGRLQLDSWVREVGTGIDPRARNYAYTLAPQLSDLHVWLKLDRIQDGVAVAVAVAATVTVTVLYDSVRGGTGCVCG